MLSVLLRMWYEKLKWLNEFSFLTRWELHLQLAWSSWPWPQWSSWPWPQWNLMGLLRQFSLALRTHAHSEGSLAPPLLAYHHISWLAINILLNHGVPFEKIPWNMTIFQALIMAFQLLQCGNTLFLLAVIFPGLSLRQLGFPPLYCQGPPQTGSEVELDFWRPLIQPALLLPGLLGLLRLAFDTGDVCLLGCVSDFRMYIWE